jgi:hypothetical protein
MSERPPAICTAAVATHLANAGALPGFGSWARLEVADQALAHVYDIGFRFVRSEEWADLRRERRELLEELAATQAELDRHERARLATRIVPQRRDMEVYPRV